MVYIMMHEVVGSDMRYVRRIEFRMVQFNALIRLLKFTMQLSNRPKQTKQTKALFWKGTSVTNSLGDWQPPFPA